MKLLIDDLAVLVILIDRLVTLIPWRLDRHAFLSSRLDNLANESGIVDACTRRLLHRGSCLVHIVLVAAQCSVALQRDAEVPLATRLAFQLFVYEVTIVNECLCEHQCLLRLESLGQVGT